MPDKTALLLGIQYQYGRQQIDAQQRAQLVRVQVRHDFRTFRVDRMSDLDRLDRNFTPEAGRTLRDYLSDIINIL